MVTGGVPEMRSSGRTTISLVIWPLWGSEKKEEIPLEATKYCILKLTFQQDHNSIHTTTAVIEWFRSNSIAKMVQSPELR